MEENKKTIQKDVPNPFELWLDEQCAKLVFLIPKKVTPNQLSRANIVIGMVTGAMFLFSAYFPVLCLVGVAGILLHGIVDNLDGTLARKLNMTSDAGAFLDVFGDCVAMVAIFSGIGLSSHAHIAICMIPAILYLLNNIVMLYWKLYTGIWPFPMIGPTLVHLMIIVIVTIYYFVPGLMLSVLGESFSLIDMAILVVSPFSVLELILMVRRFISAVKDPDMKDPV